MRGMAKAPGTCGELVQGTLNNTNFLITCPINSYSEITVDLIKEQCLYINDTSRYKALQAVTKTMIHIEKRLYGAKINVNSQLPISKGMASSTADIAAACFATAQALNYQISPQEVAKIALSIEPSDGLFFPGIVAFDHVEGNYYKHIGKAIELDIMIFDFGGQVDTVVFNRRPDLQEKNYFKEPKIKEAIKLVEKGFHNNNPSLVAQGATISALANQSILDKPNLEDILDKVVQKGALGINIAHSGTLMGIFVNKNKADLEQIKRYLLINYLSLKYINTYKLVDGGVVLKKNEEAQEWGRYVNMAVT